LLRYTTSGLRLASIDSPKYCPLQETEECHGCWSFQIFCYLFRPSSYQICCFWQLNHFSLGISLLLSVEWRQPMAFLYFFKVRSDGPDNTRYPQDLLQYSDLRRYPVARSGGSSSIFGKGGFVYFSGLIFIRTASPRVLARYQSRVVNCTKLNILQTVSLTLLICTVQDICIGRRLFCGHQRTRLSQAVSGFRTKNEYSRRKSTLFFTSTPPELHHDSTTSF
jgi:hypothetical protein